MYQRLPEVAIDTAAAYVPGTSPAGAWPSEQGCPAATSRSSEALVTERWQLAWEAPLAAAKKPDGILVGPGLVVASGESARAAFSLDGQALGTVGRGRGTCFFDLAGERMLADDPEGGLFSYLLPTLERDGRIMLAYPTRHVTRTLLQGPGVLAILSVNDTPFGPPPDAVVEVVRVRDWGDTGKRKVHYGLDPVAGIIREGDGNVHAAASETGPVLATRDGIRWCDWQLRPLHEVPIQAFPRALSVGDNGHAHLACDVQGKAFLLIVQPETKSVVEVPLPWPVDATFVPPQLGLNGTVFLTPPGHAWVLAPDGRIRYWTRRASKAPPGSVTANGMLLLSDAQLFALSPEGERYELWTPPKALACPPVLAGGRIYVASDTTLYALAMR